MVTIYPKQIQHTTKDTWKEDGTARGTGTQLLYNDSNLKQESGFASWGNPNIKRPDNSPQTIATPSGTRRRPEEIIVTSWNVSSIPKDAKITKAQVQVKYFTEKYDSYDAPGYFPDKTEIKLMKNNGSVIKKGTIKGPTKNSTQYTVTFDSLNLTRNDLEKSKVSIKVGENKNLPNKTYGNECKVKIQYLRMAITYINPTPKYSISLTPNKTSVTKNESYTCSLKVTNKNAGHNKNVVCYVKVPNNSTVKGLTAYKNGIYKIDVNKDNTVKDFTISHSTTGTKTISAYMSQYGDNTPSRTITVKDIQYPKITLKLEPIIRKQGTNKTVTTNTFYEKENEFKFKVSLKRSMAIPKGKKEEITIDTAGLITEGTINNGVHQGKGIWKISNTSSGSNTPIEINDIPFVNLDTAGTYNITVTYTTDATIGNTVSPQKYKITVKSTPLEKNFFKLRLEDGTDVQYNSLSFAKGDDLKIPLTYTMEDYTDIKDANFIIEGETRRIPINEPEYISFNINLKDCSEDIENVLAYIEATTEDGKDCSDIIIGVDSNGVLLQGNEKKYCLIKNISFEDTTTLKIAVQSEIEQNCIIKLKPYNYDLYPPNHTEWKAGKVVFKDLPNIKMHIESSNDDIATGDTIDITYCLENKSNIEGVNLKYKIKEPYGFTVKKDVGNISDDYGSDVSFNKTSRVWQFTKMPVGQSYALTITYEATKKGVHNFVLETVDNVNTTEDDQHKNSCRHQVMVDIVSNVNIHTSVTNHQPEVNQLIDYVITVTNTLKHQDEFYFDIMDIGDFNPGHNDCHYTIEHIKTDKGEFSDKETLLNSDENTPPNIIGRWTLSDIPVNGTYQLTLSLRPTETGLHSIKTIFTNPQKGNKADTEQQIFTERIKVLENKKQIDFNVYHAVNDDDIDCSEITEENLIRICDNDYINLSDSIYYIIEVINNDVLELKQPINIYARLPKSFLENKYCSAPNDFIKDDNSSLLNYQLQSIPGCKNGKTYLYLKVKPSEVGEFTANFMLSTKTAKVLHKSLHLTVGSDFKQKELEHEIKIYNFDKTNKYYRYEIDSQGEIFKFYNTGDKTVRPIETETYNVNAVETYTGTNLKEIVRDIKKNSKYVDPVYLRQGSNKLKDKGYELYPDGLIRRFGLLKSEVFHYTNQIPITSDLIERAMRWDIDEWDTKIWAGGDYDNGVFDLTVDYDKIPSNFDINSAEGLVKNLQAIVDKTKPYGTKGKCYCSANAEVSFGISIEDVQPQVQNNIELIMNLNDIYLLTTYNRSDNSLVYLHDDIDFNMEIAHKISCAYEKKSTEENVLTTGVDAGVSNVCVYESSMKKQYINDITDILNNLYNTNNNTNNIDITIPYQNFNISNAEPQYINGYQAFNYNNNHNDKLIGLSISSSGKNIVEFGYIEENRFKGFKLKFNNNTVNQRLIRDDVETFSVMSQKVENGADTIIHFWASFNNGEYYHIGFINLTKQLISESNNNGNLRTRSSNNKTPTISFLNGTGTYSQGESTIPITFKVSDKIKTQTKQHDNIIPIEDKKWMNLKNINHSGYASISYNSNIHKDCDQKYLKVPKLLAKYNNINLNRLDEVVGIDFEIIANSNKENFLEDININLLRDGDYYYPDNGISRKTYYPQDVFNTEQQMLTKYIISQNNITICGDCLKTSLGVFDKCPYCNSENISYYDEKQPVTVCNSCGWVTNGTHSYCHHCLSKDVENVDVDYNKTYCYECKTLSNDYYKYCPNCFSSDTVYLDNKKNAYILEKGRQNIEPITINTQQVESDINIFNIEIPFGKDSDILNEISNLTLNIECTNNNSGEYYYCKDCQNAGLGNFSVCPECNSENIINKKVKSNIFEAYLLNKASMSKIDLDNHIVEKGHFTRSIDLLSIAKKINSDSFTLQLYVDNPNLEENIRTIEALDIDDKYKQKMLDNLNNYNFTIDNIYVDYDFISSKNKWSGLTNLENEEHTGIKYAFEDESESESIVFGNFDIKTDKYKHAYLYLAGICKTPRPYTINLEITDSKHRVHNRRINNITETLFNREIDLVDIVGNNLENIKIAVNFDGNDITDIIITDCNILTEKESNDITNQLMTNVNIEYNEKGDCILFTSDDMWGLKNIEPYYVLSGKALESNLLAYIDFGALRSSEYIRVYNINMNIYYKSKVGKITTESIPIYDNNKIEQYITGEINNKGGEIWGFIEQDEEDLNNLAYESISVNEDGKLLNSIPLNKKISQSFTSSTNEISKINLEYFGKKGYPSDVINMYLYDDYNNNPGNLIAQSQIEMSTNKEIINIDFDINELNIGEQYWIVLEDKNADANNYHRFNYSKNNIGTLIAENMLTTSQSLCFSINYPYKTPYFNLPIMWTINNNTDTLKLDDNIIDKFFYDEEMESLIIKVVGVNGDPNTEITYKIYTDNEELNEVPSYTMNLPKHQSNVHIDISALEKNKEYYIEIIPTQVDDMNYFILYYDNIDNTIIANNNTNAEYDYTGLDNNEIVELQALTTQDSDIEYKMANILYRYNTKSSNVYLSKIIIRNGYNIEC